MNYFVVRLNERKRKNERILLGVCEGITKRMRELDKQMRERMNE